MAKRSPKQIMDDLDEVLDALRELAPDKTFGGVTLADYDRQVGKSAGDRQGVTDAEIQVSQKINQREATDEISLSMREKIVNGIIGDPDFGPDSTLYEKCGYVRKSDRKSGLTRKKVKDENNK